MNHETLQILQEAEQPVSMPRLRMDIRVALDKAVEAGRLAYWDYDTDNDGTLIVTIGMVTYNQNLLALRTSVEDINSRFSGTPDQILLRMIGEERTDWPSLYIVYQKEEKHSDPTEERLSVDLFRMYLNYGLGIKLGAKLEGISKALGHRCHYNLFDGVNIEDPKNDYSLRMWQICATLYLSEDILPRLIDHHTWTIRYLVKWRLKQGL